MRRLIGALLVSLTAAVLLLVAAPRRPAPPSPPVTRRPTTTPPGSGSAPGARRGAIDAARAGDVTEGLQHSGHGRGRGARPAQRAHRGRQGAADHRLAAAAGCSQLTWQRASALGTDAFQAVATAPSRCRRGRRRIRIRWPATWVAPSYAALSPGLKSVVQRIATIVTGDTKPAMPDEAWSTWMTPAVKAGWDARPDHPVRLVRGVADPARGGGRPGDRRSPCSATPGRSNWLCHATQAVAGAVVATVDFVSNPLGYLAAAFSAAAAGMMTFVADVANHGTAPDLTASWWISAYTKGLAIGVVLLGFVLLYEIVQVARRRCQRRRPPGDGVDLGAGVVRRGAVRAAGGAVPDHRRPGYLTDGIVSSMTGYGAGDAFTAVAQATKDGVAGAAARGTGDGAAHRDRGAGVGVRGVHLAVRAGGDHLPGVRGVRGRLGVDRHPRGTGTRRGGSRCCSSGWCSPRRCCSSCSASRWRSPPRPPR